MTNIGLLFFAFFALVIALAIYVNVKLIILRNPDTTSIIYPEERVQKLIAAYIKDQALKDEAHKKYNEYLVWKKRPENQTINNSKDFFEI